jgi:geranylgeranyl reductase family protein
MTSTARGGATAITNVGTADVAIVGAGPSGAWSAYLLARRGARVLLFDPSHPREKPCGGGVTGRAISLVAGSVPLEGLASVRIEGATFLDHVSRRSARVVLHSPPGRDALLVASRQAFDGLLLDAARAAGATLVPARVTDVARENGGFRINTYGTPVARGDNAGRAHHARFLIGADGANSLVRRRMGQAFTREQLSVATGFFAHGATSTDIVIDMVTDPPGYVWSFPRPDHLAIGICAQADAGASVGALRDRTAAWIDATGIARGARLTPYSWPIPSLSSREFDALQAGGPGWLLTGDAAGLVDPITREGIYFALLSGQFAVDALSAGGPRPDRDYAARLGADVLPELACAARFKRRFFQPRFNDLLLHALGRSAKIRSVMADLVAGEQSYRGLKWRLLRTLEIGLGWQARQALRD